MSNQSRFVELKMDCSLPEELQYEIERYVTYLNEDESGEYLSEDCYQTCVLMEINACIRERTLDPEDIAALKRYYVRGGIHECCAELPMKNNNEEGQELG